MLVLLAVAFLLSGVCAGKEGIWIVTQDDAELWVSPDGEGQVAGRLYLFSYIVGVETDARVVRVTFPEKGFVQQRSLLRISAEVIDAELINAESASSFSAGDGVLGSRGFSLSWIDQWPIGAGTLGALVGGTFGGDVIPVAVPNYYVASREGLRKTLVRKFEKSRVSNVTDSDAFRLAREALRDGDFTTAEKRSREMPRGVLGRFEYMGDIVLVTSRDVMSVKSTFASRLHAAERRHENSSMLPSNKANNILTRRRRAMRKDADGGPRQEALQGILTSLQDGSDGTAELDWGRDATSISGLDSASPPPPPPVRHSSDSQPSSVPSPQKFNYLQTSYLELNGGVSSSFHLARFSSDANANEEKWRRVSVQHRTWFVSRLQQQSRAASKKNNEAVLIGRISCNPPVSLLADNAEEEEKHSKPSSDEGCLSTAVQLARSTHVLDGFPPRVTVEIVPSSAVDKQNQQQQIRLGLAIGPSSEALGPHAYTCAAIQCVPSSPSSAKARMDYLSPGTVVCRHGHEVQIFASAAAQEGQEVYRRALEAWARFVKTVPEEENSANLLFDPKVDEIWGGEHDFGYNASKALELKERCWRNVDRAMSLGREEMLKRNRASVSSEMRRVELKLGDARGNGVSAEREGKGKAVDEEEALLLQRSESLYQFGRYLFLSSASSHALNLQGVWGEGRVSVWNADYHLNVNLQMAYWAADSARLSHLSMPPLVALLRKLRLEGSGVARSLFSCPGWVALGNLDGLSFNPTLNSEPHWALCVSCGAWAALSLWDHLSFAHVSSSSGAEAMEELLLSFRGIAEFFLVHMTSLGQGGTTSTLHVGPSSSPENSYGLMSPSYLDKMLFEMSASSSAVNQTDQVASRSASSHSSERGDEGREFAPRQKRSPARRSVDGAGASNTGVDKSRRSGRKSKEEQNGRALLSEEDKKLSERVLDSGDPEKIPGAPATFTKASLPENIANLLFQPPHQHPRVVKKNRRSRNTKELANTLLGLDPSLSQSTAFLAFSTALDLSVLRNVAVAYGLALDLDAACSSKAKPRGQKAGQFACSSMQSKDDRRVAARFLAAVKRLPYSALPVQGHNGAVLEYPVPFPATAAFPCVAASGAASGSDAGLSSTSGTSGTSGTRSGNLKGQKSANLSVPRVDWFIREDVDSQHRHFSSMHWLYPGLFQPSSGASVGVGVGVSSATSQSSLWRAANESLTTKHESGSGHTSWSASWEACLWARLGAGDLSWKALTRLSEKYSTVRLMSLHPHLVKRRLGSSKCSTCYEEQLSTAYAIRNRVRRKVDGSVTQRGANGEEARVTVDFVMVHRENRARRLPENARQLSTRDKSSFQLDGNLGYVAAVNEMLLQSHTPSILRLLPALPAAWASGKVLGLGARGDVVVSMSWRAGRVRVARLEFLSPHPWNAGLAETSPGYFSWAPGALNVASQVLKLLVSFPQAAATTRKGKKKPAEAAKLSIKSSADARGRSCASAASSSSMGSFQDAYNWLLGSKTKTNPSTSFAEPSLLRAEGRGSLLLTLRAQLSWPCVVLLCAQLDDCEDL